MIALWQAAEPWLYFVPAVALVLAAAMCVAGCWMGRRVEGLPADVHEMLDPPAR